MNSGHYPEGFFSEGYSDHFPGREIKIPKSIVGDGNLKKDSSFRRLKINRVVSFFIGDIEYSPFNNILF